MSQNNDTIYRQAAMDALCDNCDNVQAVCAHYPCKQYTAIDALPSAEPEIIRCKDCKWFENIGCAISIADDSDKPTENDFCSFAERRE